MVMIDALFDSCAIIAAMIFTALSIFQLLLASGVPIAEYSWGGKYKGKLPMKLRIASGFAVPVLIFAAIVMIGRIDLVDTGIHPTILVICSWTFTSYLALNILGNLTSKSKKEKVIMGPVSIVAFLCCLMVSIFG